MHDFSGQTAVVTGGTRGIGRAVSEALLDAGARVVATFVLADDAARAFAASRDPEEGRLRVERFDIADHDAVESFFRGLEDDPGSLEILVNNSGIRRDSVLAMMGREDWERVLAVNLTGTWQACKFAARMMVGRRYGRIVNVVSPSGRFGFPGQANYAASKAGVEAMTRSLAKEVASRGVTANCVSPGFVATGLLADLTPEQVEKHRATIPLRRFAEPGEIAPAVLFLASREAAYVTGTTLEVSGGL